MNHRSIGARKLTWLSASKKLLSGISAGLCIPGSIWSVLMKTILALVPSLIVAQALAVVAAEPPQKPGPFVAGNKAIGTWKQVTSGKASPFTNDKTTTESKSVAKAIVNGWFLEGSIEDGPNSSKSLAAIDPDGKGMRVWLFAQGNVVTLAGKIDDETTTHLSGTDQYGNTAELTDKWIDNEHREGTFIVKSLDGNVLIDVTTKLSRIDK
jgi:hypothetical protein